MEINIIGNTNSIVNQFLAEIRDVEIQKDPMRFRRNMERLGEVFAYEISKHLIYADESITTPLGTSIIPVLKDFPVIATILRAGLPLHQGLLNYFDRSGNAFVSAYRNHRSEDGGFDIKVEYLSSPSLDNKTLIVADPMLATGQSMVMAYNALLKNR